MLCAVWAGVASSGDLKHADWHPDGTSLVAEGSCAGGIDLYLIDLQTGQVRRLFDSGNVDGYPRWFPDGRRIAFHQIDAQRRARIYLADLSQDGELDGVKPVSRGPFDIEPAPSPDGARLAFSSAGEAGQDIAVLELSSGDTWLWQTDLAENFPSWQADGMALLYHARRGDQVQIYRRRLDDDEVEQITVDSSPNLVGQLAPDARRMVFSSERDGDRELYVRDMATGNDIRLTDRPGRDGYPKFSPDGALIAYHRIREDGAAEVRVLDPGTGRARSFSCAALAGEPAGTG